MFQGNISLNVRYLSKNLNTKGNPEILSITASEM